MFRQALPGLWNFRQFAGYPAQNADAAPFSGVD
jgi:hypothetical protein